MDNTLFRNLTIVLVIVLLLLTSTGITVATKQPIDNKKTCKVETAQRSFSHYDTVTYQTTIEQCEKVTIRVHNSGDDIRKTGFVIRSGPQEIDEKQFNLTPGQTRSWSYNLTPHMDILKQNHTVVISTFGDYTQYNFTRDINYTNGTEIPHTHIEDVKVTNGTIDGEPSTVAKVTLSNPSIQMYSTKLMVYTEGTDGSLYGASVAPGENRTITVELLEERGAKVAGEARLYAGNVSEREGGLDQVEFVGRAGSNTTTWNESYEPVTGPWRDDHYVYQNESIETGADRNGIVPDLSETQLLYAGAGVALVGLGGLKRLLT